MSDISVGTLGASTTPDASTPTALQGLDQDTFLDLLVAQMRYQNPMSPVDSSEYLGQAAQYAAVEQLTNVAQGQAELRSMQMISIATNMVGQEVTAVIAGTGEEITGEVSSVRFGTEPILIVDGAEIPLLSVLSVNDSESNQDEI